MHAVFATLWATTFFFVGRCVNLDWELALVLENQIKLLNADGMEIESKSQPFSSLKALAYDNVREQFIVSDMDGINDTIYTVQLSKETDTTVPIIQELPGDVQGLTVDPIDDILYWTDAINHTINYVYLNGTYYESKPFFVFNDEEKRPHSIVVDVCKRYIYWTNPSKKPTIERAKVDGTNREVLVNTSIISPEGLVIDYKSQRLYWADSRIGSIAGRIESINLDGTDRRVVVERNTMQPFGIAVDENAIYWTDTNNKGLYRFPKDSERTDAIPQKLLEFDKVPMGLVANNNIVKELPDCTLLERAIETHKMRAVTDRPARAEAEKDVSQCLNDGELAGDECKCRRGFVGRRCETSICHNYCVTGYCYLSSMGKPMCRCEKDFQGERCERSRCDGYCLNGGQCYTYEMEPRCHCDNGFAGGRCEYSNTVCEFYCFRRDQGGVFSDALEAACRCHRNRTEQPLPSAQTSQEGGILSNLNDPLLYLAALLVVSLLIIVSLVVYIRSIYKRRPRIKKRIIVNKNVTPLTYRPQPTSEQCEITIENCCNMNVCETPCFEPREDKKKLLNSMVGDDLY